MGKVRVDRHPQALVVVGAFVFALLAALAPQLAPWRAHASSTSTGPDAALHRTGSGERLISAARSAHDVQAGGGMAVWAYGQRRYGYVNGHVRQTTPDEEAGDIGVNARGRYVWVLRRCSGDGCRFWTYDVRAGGRLRRRAAPKPSAPNCVVRQIALWYRRVAWFEVCNKPMGPDGFEPQGLFRLRDAGRPAVTLYGPVNGLSEDSAAITLDVSSRGVVVSERSTADNGEQIVSHGNWARTMLLVPHCPMRIVSRSRSFLNFRGSVLDGRPQIDGSSIRWLRSSLPTLKRWIARLRRRNLAPGCGRPSRAVTELRLSGPWRFGGFDQPPSAAVTDGTVFLTRPDRGVVAHLLGR